MPSGAHTPLPPHTPGPFQSTELQSVAMAVPSSQTISDKLHHAFAYFLQFVFVRTKRIETNAISAQKTHKKRREKAEQKSSKTRESTRRIKIKPNKGVPATPPPTPAASCRARIVHSNYAAALFPFLPQQQLESTPRYMPIAVAQTPTAVATTTSTRTPPLFISPSLSLSAHLRVVYLRCCHLLCVPSPSLHVVTLYIVFKNIVCHKFGDSNSSSSRSSAAQHSKIKLYFSSENAGICLVIISTVSQVNCL